MSFGLYMLGYALLILASRTGRICERANALDAVVVIAMLGLGIMRVFRGPVRVIHNDG
jgi:hypothetical protein